MGSPSERTLSEPLDVFRLHDPRFEPLDSSGARLHGGRWNSPGSDVVYASLTFAGAILETRVHANVRTPPPRRIAVITIPAGVRIAELDAQDVRGWDDTDLIASRTAGDAWIASARSVALVVPGKAGAPIERNILLNLLHPDARKLHLRSLGDVSWDVRLFVDPEEKPMARRPKKRPGAPRRKR
jgi:RES domain-containing protein